MSTAGIQVVRHLLPRQALAALEKDRSTHARHHQAWLSRIYVHLHERCEHPGGVPAALGAGAGWGPGAPAHLPPEHLPQQTLAAGARSAVRVACP